MLEIILSAVCVALNLVVIGILVRGRGWKK